MTSITACAATASVWRGVLVQRKFSADTSSCVAIGLPKMARLGKIMCSNDVKPKVGEKKRILNKDDTSLLVGALASGAMTISTPFSALALVDERLSTEGTGLPFGLSNNLLGWILLGVFGLIWSFYFIYTASLEEDEDSGLSL